MRLQVKEIGSFHIGGRGVTLRAQPVRELSFTAGGPVTQSDSNGDIEVEQMYVQYVRLERPKARYPLLLWHGGGLTGVTWETKPDGAPGWQMYFLCQGHDVYVSDAVERGRASWAPYPEVFAGDPVFRTKREAWELFRFGPEGSYASAPHRRVAHPDGQFPVDAFERFASQAVPRWASNDAVTRRAYDRLVDAVGPCVVLTHSQGGNFGFNATLNAPRTVRAMISIEPSGAPDPAQVDVASLRHVPHLVIWGDYLAGHARWTTMRAASDRYMAALRANGGRADIIDLPARGIRGNSHMPMMDRNSDQVAQLVQDWIAAQGLML